MTTLENHQIKGITVKNIIVTLISTVSIVVSVMTAYYGLKSDIQKISADRISETRLANLRLTLLENEVALLQKEVNAIKFSENSKPPTVNTTTGNQHLLTTVK